MTIAHLQRHTQRGQSLAEFLVALTVLLPLFFAINYAGKYSDIQHAANQAGRYVAMQRAVEPSAARLSDATLRDQAKVRFFTDSKLINKGRLQSDDNSASVKKDKALPALWRDQKFGALLKDLNQVDIQFVGAPMSGTAIGTAGKVIGKTYTTPTVARVEVTLVNKMDLATAKPADLKLAAATAAVGNRWTTSGNTATIDTVERTVPSSAVDFLNAILTLATTSFEGTGHDFELGCIKPDVVASHRLKDYSTTEACP